ncbi:tripartite tricarboxylate transporter substrate binding protein [Cupriavidus respiraculi]|uniref:tripartite tricarboxylate transporter substrate binding protein n=1 Tax=Cupriavidus respiraculi TaxID=195930 RepID=UPI001C93AA38|nr:tripartite tricarboxylate transporter substrate binding protein [Cupriavidus respiraculi]MBY4947203.1 tripartite tricarboxylate transporter substrate binding protein [Cupriavidus respiraculi]
MTLRKTIRGLVPSLLLLAATLSPTAHAAYPDKPLRLIVPWAAGGSTDAFARALAKRMSETMGQSVVVENRSGASGRIGLETAAKAAPDGYTLAVVELPHAIAPAVFTQMPYDLLRDFAPVSLMGESPLILFADSGRYKAGDIQRFLADARKAGPLQMATSGNGSISHLSAKLLEAQADVKVDVVPYRGSAPALTDVAAQLVAGHFATLASGSSLLGTGKLSALMVTGATRLPALPMVPTAAEARLPGMQLNQWWAMVVPAKTPPEIVARLEKEVNQALQHGATRDRLSTQGIELKGSSREQLGAFLRSEVARWAKVVKDAGIQPE